MNTISANRNNRNSIGNHGTRRCSSGAAVLDRTQTEMDNAVQVVAKAHTLATAVVEAEKGNLEPLQQFLSAECHSRRERGMREVRNYRLWIADKDEQPVTILNPEGLPYTRVEEHERIGTGRNAETLHYVRHFLYKNPMPDQVTCDRINTAARRFGLKGRINSKHDVIYQTLIAALDSRRIDWEESLFGGWQTTPLPADPAPVTSSSDFDDTPARPLAFARPSDPVLQHMYQEGM